MVFVEQLDMHAIRSACIEYSFCTRMSNEEYADMLNIATRDLADHTALTEVIEEMTSVIVAGSTSENATPENIASILFRRCVNRFVY